MTNKIQHTLQLRANVLAQIRDFFAKRGILEVETPILSQHTVTDIHIQSFSSQYQAGDFDQTYYLQTSPEYAMKRLLSEGSGPIFQICKNFRNSELGRLHNPEFTMLEWYRPGFDHHALMNEVDELLQSILNGKPAIKKSYQEVFLENIGLDPLTCELNCLYECIEKNNITDNFYEMDHDTCLQLLLSHLIEPKLGFSAPLFIYDFPSTQAALSKVRKSDPPVAERFEVYIQGMEIANGFNELNDPKEQLSRFQTDQKGRRLRGLSVPSIDMRLIAALEKGFPDCAGVALGIDRLLMIKANARQISDVINFPWEQA